MLFCPVLAKIMYCDNTLPCLPSMKTMTFHNYLLQNVEAPLLGSAVNSILSFHAKKKCV